MANFNDFKFVSEKEGNYIREKIESSGIDIEMIYEIGFNSFSYWFYNGVIRFDCLDIQSFVGKLEIINSKYYGEKVEIKTKDIIINAI